MSRHTQHVYGCDLCGKKHTTDDKPTAHPRDQKPLGWIRLTYSETDPVGHIEDTHKDVCAECINKVAVENERQNPNPSAPHGQVGLM